jgi:hypothetical protein
VEARARTLSVSTAVSHLVEDRVDDRRLDAVSLGAGLDRVFGGRWSGEVAERQYATGQGLGWGTTFSRRSASDNVDVRYMHAPGGTRAFARASNELSGSASRSFGRRVALNANGWESADDGSATFSGLSSRGWALGSNLLLGRDAGVSAVARSSEFTASTVSGDFGSGERSVDASLDVRRGAVTANAGASTAMMTRRTTFDDAAPLVQRAPRWIARAGVSGGGERGTIDLTGHVDVSGPGIGLPRRLWAYGAQLERITLVGGRRPAVTLDASAERVGGLAVGTDPLSLHGGVTLLLPLGVAVAMSAERNPFLFTEDGRSRWMYVVNLTKAAQLPRLARRQTRGLVFRDLNGNGRRDAGEPGLPGVVIRRGSDVAITDRDGEYAFAGDVQGPLELDARSLPMGWLAPSTMLEPRQSVAVVAVAPVVARLDVVSDDTSRVHADDLERVIVMARDSNGRIWLARHTSPEALVFDALPPGSYTLAVDVSASREPLRVDPPPAIVVTTGRRADAARIRVRARALHFNDGPGP